MNHKEMISQEKPIILLKIEKYRDYFLSLGINLRNVPSFRLSEKEMKQIISYFKSLNFLIKDNKNTTKKEYRYMEINLEIINYD